MTRAEDCFVPRNDAELLAMTHSSFNKILIIDFQSFIKMKFNKFDYKQFGYA